MTCFIRKAACPLRPLADRMADAFPQLCTRVPKHRLPYAASGDRKSHIVGTLMFALMRGFALRSKMTEIAIGYARCSTHKQDMTVQCEALIKLGVEADKSISTTA